MSQPGLWHLLAVALHALDAADVAGVRVIVVEICRALDLPTLEAARAEHATRCAYCGDNRRTLRGGPAVVLAGGGAGSHTARAPSPVSMEEISGRLDHGVEYQPRIRRT